jgi:hypothetical protein
MFILAKQTKKTCHVYHRDTAHFRWQNSKLKQANDESRATSPFVHAQENF